MAGSEDIDQPDGKTGIRKIDNYTGIDHGPKLIAAAGLIAGLFNKFMRSKCNLLIC